MITLSRTRLAVSLITLVVWLLAAASLSYWLIRLSAGREAPVTMPPAVAAIRAPDSLAIARILGAVAEAQQPAATVASRFSLQGVVAGTPGGGAALISVDGKPAKPFRVGSQVEEGLILKSAVARRAILSESSAGPALVTLDMPALVAN